MIYGCKPPEGQKILRYKPVKLPANVFWRYFRAQKMHYLFRIEPTSTHTVLGAIYKHEHGYKFRAQSLYNDLLDSQLFKTLRASKRFVERESYFKGAFK